jgi:hypothetical protein
MKQIKTKSEEIGIIEIPENSTNDLKHYYNLELNNNELIYTNKVLGKLSELTDKDCEEFVEIYKIVETGLTKSNPIKLFKYYQDELEYVYTQKASFISLLQSEGIDTSNEDKLLIIKIL